MNKALLPVLIFGILASSCSIVSKSPKYSFANGIYTSKVFATNSRKVYVDNKDENITVYAALQNGDGFAVDSVSHRPLLFSDVMTDSFKTRPSFLQTSFDMDVLTMPFKYRFSTEGFPRQFTTQLNGGLYLGYRSDIYVLHYEKNPLGIRSRHTNHFGFSVGGFTGIGSTNMNPWVARDQITIEYEGVAWSKGIAVIAGLNNFTAGVALGWDHLLDNNKAYWIYEGKPWLGIVFGLNLN